MKDRTHERTLVHSRLGNTARLAEAVAQLAGPGAWVIRVGQPDSLGAMLRALDSGGPDLVVGGPTVGRGIPPALGAMLEALEGRVGDRAVAAFDPRLRGPGLLMGSAAKRAGERLREVGAHLVGRPEAFYVRRGAAASRGHARRADVTPVPGRARSGCTRS